MDRKGIISQIERFGVGDKAWARAVARPVIHERVPLVGLWQVWGHGPDGQPKWHEVIHNTIVTVGRNEILDQFFGGSGYTAALFAGLKGSGSVNAADEMDSHAGWSTISAYSNATDPAYTVGAAAAGSIDNSGSPAVFTMNGAYTAAGAFLKTDNTKGGTAGILISAADFSTARSGDSGDTITVTVTYAFS